MSREYELCRPSESDRAGSETERRMEPPHTKIRTSDLERKVDALNEHVAALAHQIAALYRMLDEGIGSYLNARFPYGKPTDRWRRRG